MLPSFKVRTDQRNELDDIFSINSITHHRVRLDPLRGGSVKSGPGAYQRPDENPATLAVAATI